jgi:hypothetical protein
LYERRGKQSDRLDLALDPDDRDVFADPIGFGKNDCQPGHDVAENPLGRQRYARAGNAQSGNERQQLDSEVLQGHDCEQGQDRQARHAREQHSHRGFEFQSMQGSCSDTSRTSGIVVLRPAKWKLHSADPCGR